MTPRIALTLSRPDSPARRLARQRYVEALEHAGAVVIPVDPGAAGPDSFDGLCLAGGEDVDPSRYGAADLGCERIDAERDATELALLERALRLDLPVLGICRGLQVLNVAFGGSLVQDLPGHRPVGDEVVVHEVAAQPGSLLARAVGTQPHAVNSRHHQAVTDATLAPGLRAVARVDDLIEAAESDAHRFVLGVQWHPERADEVAPAATRVFDALVEAAALTPGR
jgi:gamma-glutamyl-gamma-aminobutyrate hydrolase PuuD